MTLPMSAAGHANVGVNNCGMDKGERGAPPNHGMCVHESKSDDKIETD